MKSHQAEGHVKHLTWQKNMRKWAHILQLYTYATQSVSYFASVFPFYKQEKHHE